MKTFRAAVLGRRPSTWDGQMNKYLGSFQKEKTATAMRPIETALIPIMSASNRTSERNMHFPAMEFRSVYDDWRNMHGHNSVTRRRLSKRG